MMTSGTSSNDGSRQARLGWFSGLELAGLAILARGGQLKRSALGFLVRSQSKDKWYQVVWDGRRWSCQCPFSAKTRRTCKHIFAVLFANKLNINTDMTQLEFQCPSCQADGANIERSGTYHNSSGLVQRLVCKRCGSDFTDRTSFEKMKINARTVLAAIDLYFKGLSYRKISEHLRDIYGVQMTHVAIFNWVKKYMAILRRHVKRMQPIAGRKWHCDEMKYSPGGNSEYLWNLMDAKTRFLVACQVTQHRRKAEAKQALNKGVKSASAVPGMVVTDGLASYPEAVRSLPKQRKKRVQHVTRAGQNNAVERLNQTVRERTKTMRVNNVKVLRRFADEYPLYYNYLRKHSALGKTPAEAAKVSLGKGWLRSIRQANSQSRTRMKAQEHRH